MRSPGMHTPGGAEGPTTAGWADGSLPRMVCRIPAGGVIASWGRRSVRWAVAYGNFALSLNRRATDGRLRRPCSVRT